MKQEDLRSARLIEAKRRWIENETPRREVEHLADLYETNWPHPESRPDHIVDADEMVGRPALPDREAVAREGLDRLEAAYGALSDDVFFAYPKIAAMAKELSEAQAGEMRAIAREVYERLRAETAEAQRDAALEALRPFAEAEKLTNPHDRVAVVNVSDLRAASRAIGGEL